MKRFAVALIAITPCIALAQQPQPRQVVERFCQLDAVGKQLAPDGWRETMPLLSYPNPQRPRRIFVVKDFVVNEPIISGSGADVDVDHIKIGEIDAVLERFSPSPALKVRNTFHLILTDQRLRFTHDVHVAVAKFYSENLREEVKKGMREKAEQGIYPAHAPFGYRNNPTTRAIDIDSVKAPLVKRIFELYASGRHTLLSLRKAVRSETGILINRSYFEKILKNRFYVGFFRWQGVEYKGHHHPLIDFSLFQRVQEVFTGRNKGKRRKHDFAFAGLLSCAHDGCTITSELHKGKYVYYRCSYGRGKCDLPYMPEPALSDRLGTILKDIYVPDHVVSAVVDCMAGDQGRAEAQREAQINSTQQRLAALRTRMDQAYEDRLDGKLDEQMWTRKIKEWRDQEVELEATLCRLETTAGPQNALTAQRILELANRAYSLYLTRNHTERRQLLKSVL